ncbi:uncharacterized protein LOC108153158 [Drosophila miranda]|uniref:Uncharacterized protein isoform X1 n=2 Tax=Drosophila pseudoobscura pseudoobscura TaxID=46245 RepID=A0A6I8WCW0_DROPS|nr:uncharacterized protein LOC108153158 [Drosophila miranda]XP_026848085.1 uncharacterized protein LOC6603786 isoform X1 [Drosophila persimilis]XP_033241233.1 uncharacterized protein LOC117185168 isoform X1 [Drosophila pseudoobscura]XP_033241234.1 uncharacterized protein LOC117185168 isoform X1 [Drosophila pseudoobscura]XP_033241235.1 uncharacterized protein LOC117185168 isoform X1 [Drosophila pseudoobscura]XP_033243937.1 uncharacterized protein LOC108153158 [Drosophila miranda]
MEELCSNFGHSSTSSTGSNSSISAKTALSECSAAWINYLSALNSLCTSGSKLAHSIAVLEQWSLNEKPLFNNYTTSYLTNSWNDLARATTVATGTVKTHMLAILQDFVTIPSVDQSASMNTELEQKRLREHNELIVLENAQSVINIQHQFCAASYDAFSSLTCCFVCQSPVGFPHEQDCSVLKQRSQYDQRSQTPSPNLCVSNVKSDSSKGNSLTDQRPIAIGITESVEQQRCPSPVLTFHDPNPMQAIFEHTRGPLPNPGHLLSMKTPFHRNVKSSLSFPLFPLNGQRRWSEAAAGEVIDGNSTDPESQMRRWSMPWEATKSDTNTVTWNQTRIMPMNTLKTSSYKMSSSDRYTSHNSDGNCPLPSSSQDGLLEAIQLLSIKPTTMNQINPHTCIPPTSPDGGID